MLHLNEHGWGLGTLIAFIFVFLLAILLISINAYKMGLTDRSISNVPVTNSDDNKGFTNSSNNNNITYLELENKLVVAGSSYKQLYYNDLMIGDSVYVTDKQLSAVGFIDNLVINNIQCKGYVQIKNNGDSFSYIPYLKCGDNYKSNGYIEDLS